MKAYADSSFIVALYVQQQSSPKAIALMERYGQALPFTPWHRLEVRNAHRTTGLRDHGTTVSTAGRELTLKCFDASMHL